MAKTKAELQRDLRTAKRGEELWKGHAKKAQDGEQEAFRRLDDLEHEYQELIEKMTEMMDEHMALETKHDIFVQKYRTICAEHSRQVGILRDNLEIHSKELQEAKARAEQQATKLMVAETAMQSMTIHIHLLTNQKGQNNA